MLVKCRRCFKRGQVGGHLDQRRLLPSRTDNTTLLQFTVPRSSSPWGWACDTHVCAHTHMLCTGTAKHQSHAYRQPAPLQALHQHKQHAYKQDQYKWPDHVPMCQQIRVLAVGLCLQVHTQPPHTCAGMGLSSSWSTPTVFPTADSWPWSLQGRTPDYFSWLAPILWHLHLNLVFVTPSPRYRQPYVVRPIQSLEHCWPSEFSSPRVGRASVVIIFHMAAPHLPVKPSQPSPHSL